MSDRNKSQAIAKKIIENFTEKEWQLISDLIEIYHPEAALKNHLPDDFLTSERLEYKKLVPRNFDSNLDCENSDDFYCEDSDGFYCGDNDCYCGDNEQFLNADDFLDKTIALEVLNPMAIYNLFDDDERFKLFAMNLNGLNDEETFEIEKSKNSDFDMALNIIYNIVWCGQYEYNEEITKNFAKKVMKELEDFSDLPESLC